MSIVLDHTKTKERLLEELVAWETVLNVIPKHHKDILEEEIKDRIWWLNHYRYESDSDGRCQSCGSASRNCIC